MPTGLPSVPADPERVKIDFLPYKMPTVQRYGLTYDKVYYNHECLTPWINSADPENPKLKRKFVVRRDPRDISRVWFLDPESSLYYPIPYRDISHPAVSIWEFRLARDQVKKSGGEVDEAAIFEAIDRMRARSDGAIAMTKQARRQRHRAKRAEKISLKHSEKNLPRSEPSPERQAESTSMAKEDIYSDDIQPFDSEIGQ